MQVITISKNSTFAALLTALFAAVGFLIVRVFKSICTVLKAVHQWLQTQHYFYGNDGDPIKCTGWQFVGYNIVAAVVTILLCIKY